MDTPITDRLSAKSILVVDDDERVRVLLRAILSEQGYNVFEAVNGKDACRHVIEHKTDLLITDLVMPEQDGLETIKWIKSAIPGMKMIAISGAAEGCFLRIACVFGANEILRKPFSCSELIDMVQRLLAPTDSSNKSRRESR